MEYSPSFNLDGAVAEWRDSLRRMPALCERDLDELEAHLRDSILRLKAEGRTDAEVFRIACERLGSPAEIGREYAKVKSGRVWTDRIVWMLAGLLLWGTLRWVSSAGSYLVVHGLIGRLSPHWLGFASTLAEVSLTLCIALAFWGMVTRLQSGSSLAEFMSLSLKRPLLPFLALISLNYSAPVLWRALSSSLGPLPEREIVAAAPILNLWNGRSSQVEFVLWAAALVWLVRLSCSRSSANAGRLVWAERAVWMIAGVLVSRQMLGPLTILPDLWMDYLALRWTAAGAWLGPLAVCVQWATVLAGVVIAVRLVRAGESAVSPVVRCHPILGTGAILLLLFLSEAVLMLLAPHLPEHQWTATRGIISSWSSHGRTILFNVVPVALVLTLARRRWDFRNRWI